MFVFSLQELVSPLLSSTNKKLGFAESRATAVERHAQNLEEQLKLKCKNVMGVRAKSARRSLVAGTLEEAKDANNS